MNEVTGYDVVVEAKVIDARVDVERAESGRAGRFKGVPADRQMVDEVGSSRGVGCQKPDAIIAICATSDLT